MGLCERVLSNPWRRGVKSCFPSIQADHVELLQARSPSCALAFRSLTEHDCFSVMQLYRDLDQPIPPIQVLEVTLGRVCHPRLGSCNFTTYESLYERYQQECGDDEPRGWGTNVTDAAFVLGMCRELPARNPDGAECFINYLRVLLNRDAGNAAEAATELCSLEPLSCLNVVESALNYPLRSSSCITDEHRLDCARSREGRLCAEFTQYDGYCGSSCPSAVEDIITNSECQSISGLPIGCFRDSEAGCPRHNETDALCYGLDPEQLKGDLVSNLERVCNVDRAARTASCSDDCRTFARTVVADNGCCLASVLRDCGQGTNSSAQFRPWDIIEESCEDIQDEDIPLPDFPDTCSFLLAATMAPVVAASAACCGFPWF